MSTIAVDFIKDSFQSIHGSYRDARSGQTPEQMHFAPEGESHSVAWILFHTTRIEDMLINTICQSKPLIFAEGDWAERTGLPAEGFGTGQTTEQAGQVGIKDLDAFTEYAEAVYAATDAFLDGISDEDLSREVKLGQRTETVSDNIRLHLLTHLNGHRGEINLIRGMQGLPPLMANARGQAPF